METVEVVIRLPKEDFDYVQETVRKQEYPLSKFYHNIANGTVLPKGHGRLIDADAFEHRCMFDSNVEDMQDVIYALLDYPSVIEADREVEQDESD